MTPHWSDDSSLAKERNLKLRHYRKTLAVDFLRGRFPRAEPIERQRGI
jgi:hypothetical protein